MLRTFFGMFAVTAILAFAAPAGALDVSKLEPSLDVEDLRDSRDRLEVLSGVCSDTLVVNRPDLQTTFVVKVQEVCPEDWAAYLEARREGIVDPDALPDH